jgi:hypothetical protein
MCASMEKRDALDEQIRRQVDLVLASTHLDLPGRRTGKVRDCYELDAERLVRRRSCARIVDATVVVATTAVSSDYW